MKKIFSLLMALMLVFALVGCGSTSDNGGDAAAEDTVYSLTMSLHEPAESAQGVALQAWVDQLREESNGRLDITIVAGGALGGPRDEVNLLETGSIDMCWNVTSHNPNRFNVTDVLTLPMIGIEDGIQGTKAFIDLYNTVPEIQSEFTSIFKPLAVHLNALVPISTHKKIESIADMKGLQLRTGVAFAISWLQNLGAEGVSFSISDSYENMSKNVCDGLLNDWVNVKANQLFEVIDYMLDINVGAPLGFVAMNWDTWNSLPEDLQQLLDGDFEELSLALGQAFADGYTAGTAAAAEFGTEVYQPTEEMQAAFQDAAEPIVQEWLDARTAEGIDGQAILDATLAAIEANK